MTKRKNKTQRGGGWFDDLRNKASGYINFSPTKKEPAETSPNTEQQQFTTAPNTEQQQLTPSPNTEQQFTQGITGTGGKKQKQKHKKIRGGYSAYTQSNISSTAYPIVLVGGKTRNRRNKSRNKNIISL